ncbi:MAG: type II toxin-antitoxin system RelE/ParE family toxin [Gallionellaceae bacterium]
MLLWTPHARKQRHDAIEYIAQDNHIAALKQLDEIEKQTDTLLLHPEIGRTGRRSGTRELLINRTSFVVVYRIKAKHIEIVRLLHTSQPWLVSLARIIRRI